MNEPSGIVSPFPNTVANILQRAMTAKAITRGDVIAFEKEIRKHPAHLTGKDFIVYHHFSPGIYMRELHIPAGMVTIGKIHKYPCLNILAQGKRATLVDGQIEVIEAPHVHLSPAGMKRASLSYTDSVWITVHPNPTNSVNIEKLEAGLVCESEADYQAFLDTERPPCHS